MPTSPEGDCDADGVKNAVDLDDDNDLLPDGLELSLPLDPCVIDTDGDGVEDGYEYLSAIDLNNDDYQSPNVSLPYPGKTPYPNPLFKDGDVDYDGDGLAVDEFKLWKYTYQVNYTAARTLSPLSYSDGTQNSSPPSRYGRRLPTMATTDYTPPLTFRTWAAVTGYATSSSRDTSTVGPYDMDRSGVARSVRDRHRRRRPSSSTGTCDTDGYVSDDERDEDADGLTNYDETTAR